ncbi:hypothetical protein [Cognatilysobacter segetis]|uniref:hypothetical protein n=1 Tax=Cognatilysobacter segetis TaxID=2492394 RepID=UPI00105D7FBE|nr:hypothetical protein [Lysobacter segetis]
MSRRRLPRIVLASFVVAFASARLLVLLIMQRAIPDLYLHLGGTHVHHLNYGIFLLSFVGAVLLFAPPVAGRRLDLLAALYGVGLALTFDEFGMWLHLGGSYWQRASFDAITVVGALLALAAFAPPIHTWHRRRAFWAVIIVAVVALFFWQLSMTLARVEPELQRMEVRGPH